MSISIMGNGMKYDTVWRFCFKAEKWKYSCKGKLGHITKILEGLGHMEPLKVFKKKSHMIRAILYRDAFF